MCGVETGHTQGFVCAGCGGLQREKERQKKTKAVGGGGSRMSICRPVRYFGRDAVQRAGEGAASGTASAMGKARYAGRAARAGGLAVTRVTLIAMAGRGL